MNIINKAEKHLNLVMAFTLALSLILCALTEGFAAADTVRDGCLRLHILAASDSEKDQNIKLLVRDALLEAGASIFSENDTSEEAAEKILQNEKMLEGVADEVIKLNGMDYTADVYIADEYFETRQYDDVRLPAGTYKACKVVLGEGKGHNWWCIMFPPLCLPAAVKKDEEVYAVFGENGGDLVTGKNGYIIKFKIVEIVEEIIETIKKGKESRTVQ